MLNQTDVRGRTLEEALARNALSCSRIANVGDAQDEAMPTLLRLDENDNIVNSDEARSGISSTAMRMITDW